MRIGTRAPVVVSLVAVLFVAMLGSLTVLSPAAAVAVGTAAIEGRVVLSDGTPAAGARLSAYLDGTLTDSAVAAADGTFSFSGLEAGSWTLRIVDRLDDRHGFPAEWYEDVETREEATPIVLTAGQVRSGLAIEVAVGGAIEGTVVGGSGQPLADICVTAYDVGNFYARVNQARTDSDGHYRIGSLVEGLYSVAFVDCDGLYRVASEAYPDVDQLFTAAPLGVPQSEVRDGIDAQLLVEGTVAGRVTTDGEPVDGACVTARTRSDYDLESESTTAPDGTFTITGVRPGDVRVSVRSCSEATPAFAVTLSDLVVVGEDQTVGGVEIATVASDTTAPETVISSGPDEVLASTFGTEPLSFTIDTAPALEGESFECRYNQYAWYACWSPVVVNSVQGGTNTMEVRATDANGNLDPTPATWTFEYVDDTAPVPNTRITAGPAAGAVLSTTSATFAFASTPVAASFECRLDAAEWMPCTTPTTLSSLADGAHTFQVRAVDARDRRDETPASRAFSVDLVTCSDAQAALDRAEAAVAAATNATGAARTKVASATKVLAKAKAALKKAKTPAARRKARQAVTRATSALTKARAALVQAQRRLAGAEKARTAAAEVVADTC